MKEQTPCDSCHQYKLPHQASLRLQHICNTERPHDRCESISFSCNQLATLNQIRSVHEKLENIKSLIKNLPNKNYAIHFILELIKYSSYLY